jgi:hypothetical protein
MRSQHARDFSYDARPVLPHNLQHAESRLVIRRRGLVPLNDEGEAALLEPRQAFTKCRLRITGHLNPQNAGKLSPEPRQRLSTSSHICETSVATIQPNPDGPAR